MEWEEKLQHIIDYVENHLQRLEEPIDSQEVSKLAGCSYNFFQKVFSYMNKMSFSDYVRARKLTLAGYDLKSTDMKVVDISFKYGYDSPTSFTKAFQQFHGIPPKRARQNDVELKVVPKMKIKLSQNYSWKLETRETFHLIGISKQFLQNDNMFLKIPEFWNECQRNGEFTKLISLDQGVPKGLFGYPKMKDNNFEYSIMVISQKECEEGLVEYTIPKLTWVIFDCYGPIPNSIQAAWKYLYEEWLIEYPFQHAPFPDLEWYSDGNSYSEDYLTQIWIPILEDK